jgi:hypothetical protein
VPPRGAPGVPATTLYLIEVRVFAGRKQARNTDPITRLLARERDSAEGSAFGSGEDRRSVSGGRALESPCVEVR